MNLDDPAWRAAPVRTGIQVAKSLVRRAVPSLSRVVVPYDGGRSSIYADLRTPLGLGLYRYGHRDPDIDLVGRLLTPGDLFIDGGAHVGLFTLVAAERVGRGGKVIAFEPTSAIRERLRENIALNRLEQVEVVPSALSSEAGTAAFRVFGIVGSGLNHLGPLASESGDLETVPVTTLDAALAGRDQGRLRLIKLDLEGAEHAALLGASGTLREQHPDLVLEVEPRHLERMGTTAEAVEDLLLAHGYQLFRIGAEARGKARLESIASILLAAPQPNIFASVEPERARAKGVSIR